MPLICGHTYVYRCIWIDPPKDKIGICFCSERNWLFWFNTAPRFHGHGQMAVAQTDFPQVLTRDCYLDLSQVCAASPQERSVANDRGMTPSPLLEKLLLALGDPIATLPDVNRKLALENLTAANTPSTA